jgi:coenzyme F420 hydrogenase subunit beta
MTTGASPVLDPAADIRDEIASSSGVPELAGKLWFHKTASAVVDAGRCVSCGGCVVACPSRSIGIGEDGQPTLTRMCTGCSACWDFCPLAGLRTERLVGQDPANELGAVLAAYSARSRRPAAGAQDGGVVTELLAALIERGVVNGAVVTRRVGAFYGEPFIATTAEQVRAAAGSVYHQGHPLAALARPLPEGVRTLAVVGTPCQLAVLSALRRFPWRYRRTAERSVVLTIGLLCTRSFDPGALARALRAAGVDIRRVRRIDIRDGLLVARDSQGREVFGGPVRELRGATLPGCDECTDFTALAADIAVGNIGSEPGQSTVLIRTQAGLDAWRAGGASLHAAPLADLGPIARAARRNRRSAERAMPRPFDPDGPLWISHPEHLAAYAGTTRAPAAPPPHRSHHYEVSC